MNIPQEPKAAETSRPQPSAAPPQRHADWISYGVAVAQQAPGAGQPRR